MDENDWFIQVSDHQGSATPVAYLSATILQLLDSGV